MNTSSLMSSEPQTIQSNVPRVETGCISKHIREAIELNKSRAPLYAKASDGRSQMISNLLVAAEKIALTTLPLLEKPAEEYQKRGVPLFCLDVVPMSGAKKFSERETQPSSKHEPFDGLGTSIHLAKFVLTKEAEKLEGHLQKVLEKLSSNPQYNCFSRHLVESLLRSVRLTPHYRRWSAEKGLRDPIFLIQTYVSSQISGLPKATVLDSMAAELNAQGIPIICNDVPHIETETEKIFAENNFNH